MREPVFTAARLQRVAAGPPRQSVSPAAVVGQSISLTSTGQFALPMTIRSSTSDGGVPTPKRRSCIRRTDRSAGPNPLEAGTRRSPTSCIGSKRPQGIPDR